MALADAGRLHADSNGASHEAAGAGGSAPEPVGARAGASLAAEAVVAAGRDVAPQIEAAGPPLDRGPQGEEGVRQAPGVPRATTCTTAQLRRFIKSRPWVPMHELRRRFGIWGDDDDVTPIRVGEHTLFVGLPADEGRMVGELLAGGDVGYELSLDPEAPIVVGVYPMRPVPRG